MARNQPLPLFLDEHGQVSQQVMLGLARRRDKGLLIAGTVTRPRVGTPHPWMWRFMDGQWHDVWMPPVKVYDFIVDSPPGTTGKVSNRWLEILDPNIMAGATIRVVADKTTY